MSDYTFDSAKSIIREIDLSFTEPAIQSTTALALVGETLKGPAFEPIAVSTKSGFRALFGGKSPERNGQYNMKYLLPYYADSYLEEGNQLYVVRVLGKSGYNAGTAWNVTLTNTAGNPAFQNMSVAVLRSRASYVILSGATAPSLQFQVSAVTTSVAPGLDPFAIVLTWTRLDTGTQESLRVSLDSTSPDYITKVLGTNPKYGPTGLYVDALFTETISKGIGDGLFTSIGAVTPTGPLGDYRTQFQSPETPYVVSELRGNSVLPLYKFICISDGDSANTEIKISHENIDPITKYFDVVIRDFNDTDDNQIVLERYSKCSLNPRDNNFIGRRIGSRPFGQIELEYTINSKYVFLEMADNCPTDAFPAGFEGYVLPATMTTGSAAALPPKMFFKTGYTATDRVARTYLGISERGYDTLGTKGKTISAAFFAFRGDEDTRTNVKLNGFHMDVNTAGNTYTTGKFDTGVASFRSLADVSGVAPYANKASRKFTLAPYGGFDGWDLFRDERTNTEAFKPGSPLVTNAMVGLTDYDAYLNAIEVFNNPEEAAISLFATPGLNWVDHLSLVSEALDMVETVRRGDCLYVIDAPDVPGTEPADIVEMFDIADIDSSYATTYWPSIQIQDTDNNTLVFIPATGEVLRAMTYTDKVKFPWWAPAGYSRGLIQKAKRTRRKLKEADRDILYVGRINPIADFSDVGVDIFGQKTTQRAESALDRISVRRMLIAAKDLIKKVSRKLLFEQNDDVVQSQFLTQVNPILETIKRERGIEQFSVVPGVDNTPEARSRHELYFTIKCLPIGALEFIEIDFVVTPAGTTFTS
jgi:hypothetical protein